MDLVNETQAVETLGPEPPSKQRGRHGFNGQYRLGADGAVVRQLSPLSKIYIHIHTHSYAYAHEYTHIHRACMRLP